MQNFKETLSKLHCTEKSKQRNESVKECKRCRVISGGTSGSILFANLTVFSLLGGLGANLINRL